MKKQELYKSMAKYYDLIYSGKPYKEEVGYLKKIIAKYKKTTGNELLDCACGTGNHLIYLTKDFKCTGTDRNPEMLEIAREKIKGVEFIVVDMSDLDIKKKFDVITCLYSSIGYITQKERAEMAIKAFADHLKPGGVVIIEPWLTKETYDEGAPNMNIYNGEDIKIARLNTLELKEEFIAHFEMHYLVAERGKKVKHFVDLHELAMFPRELLISWMEKYGLEVVLLERGLFDDRGLLVGIKK